MERSQLKEREVVKLVKHCIISDINVSLDQGSYIFSEALFHSNRT